MPKPDAERADDEQDQKPQRGAPKPDAERADGLVEIHKDGTTLRVHPLAVHEHVKKLGWEVVE